MSYSKPMPLPPNFAEFSARRQLASIPHAPPQLASDATNDQLLREAMQESWLSPDAIAGMRKVMRRTEEILVCSSVPTPLWVDILGKFISMVRVGVDAVKTDGKGANVVVQNNMMLENLRHVKVDV